MRNRSLNTKTASRGSPHGWTWKQGGRPECLPRACRRYRVRLARHRVRRNSPVVCCALEDFPSGYRPTGSATPPRGSSTPWSSPAGRRKRELPGVPSSAFRSTPESSPHPQGAVLRHHRLSRGFCPHGATQKRRATAPGASNSGSRCVPAVPAGSDAFLPSPSPRCVSTGRALGVPLSQSLPEQRSPGLSTRASLPATWATAIGIGTRRSRGVLPGIDLSPRGVRPNRGPRTRRCRLPVPRGLQIRPPLGMGFRGALASRGSSRCRWEVRRHVSMAPGVFLLSQAFTPPWGIPLPGLGLLGCRHRPSPFGAGPCVTPGILAPNTPAFAGMPRLPRIGLLSGTSGTSPSGFVPLYYRVSKNREIGWPLSRLPAPPRFPSSSRRFPGRPVPRRVSERPSDPISKSSCKSDMGRMKCQSPPDRPFGFP